MNIEDKLFDKINETAAYWFNKSSDLNRSARVLWTQIESGNSIGHYDTYKMLMGMSFEAMAKAFCIALDKEMKRTHELTTLISDAGFKFTKKENKTLRVLTAYIEWAGKYPTPKSKNGNGPSTLKNHWDDISDLGEDAFNYDELLKIWRKMSDKFLSEHNA